MPDRVRVKLVNHPPGVLVLGTNIPRVAAAHLPAAVHTWVTHFTGAYRKAGRRWWVDHPAGEPGVIFTWPRTRTGAPITKKHLKERP